MRKGCNQNITFSKFNPIFTALKWHISYLWNKWLASLTNRKFGKYRIILRNRKLEKCALLSENNKIIGPSYKLLLSGELT